MNKLVVRLGNNIASFTGDTLTYVFDGTALIVKYDNIEAVRFTDWTSLKWFVIVSGSITITDDTKASHEE